MTSIAPKWLPDKFRDWLNWPKPDGKGKPSQPETKPPWSPDKPPPTGPRPGGGRRPVSEEPKPGSVDHVFARLEALQAAQAALKVERAAQAKRVAALAQCEHGLVERRAQDIADIQRAIDDAIKRFEELQKQLKEEVGNQLNQMAKFNEDYNKAWNKGMDGLDKYLHTYLQLLPGLKKLFDAFVDRNTALEMGHAIDEKIHQAIGAVMAVDGAAGLIRGVAKWGAEKGALEAAEGAAEAVARKGAVEGAEGVAEAAAGKGAIEGAEGVAGAAGRKGAIEGAEGAAGVAGRKGATAGVEGEAEAGLAGKGAQKGALEGAEAAGKEGAEAATAAPKTPAGARATGEAVETSKGTQTGTSQSESPAAKLTGMQRDIAEAEAEVKLKDILKPIRASAGENQCTHATEAFAKTWETGIQHEIVPTAAKEARTVGQMQELFNGTYYKLGDDPTTAIKQITQALERQGPGSQALIKVNRLTTAGTDAAGVTELGEMGHSFSAVNVDGFVKFVDVGKPGGILRAKDLETSFGWAMMLP
jgi:hypothetical protein